MSGGKQKIKYKVTIPSSFNSLMSFSLIGIFYRLFFKDKKNVKKLIDEILEELGSDHKYFSGSSNWF